MPCDGIVIAGVCRELNDKIIGLKIEKVYQPERDEIILVTRAGRLLLTAQASHPRAHFTRAAKPNPETAPQFCMLLRKHIQGGRVLSVTQPDFERIVHITVESPDEMGDYSQKTLIIEIMGKHSNIILAKDGIISDAIKHIGRDKSSVREVLPGRPYTPPPGKNKKSPLSETKEGFTAVLDTENPVESAIMSAYNGISPIIASELAHRAGIPPKTAARTLNEHETDRLFFEFIMLTEQMIKGGFSYAVYFEKNRAVDFAAVDISLYAAYERVVYETPGGMMDVFYEKKDAANRISQKSADLKKLITQNLERCVRKREIQNKTMDDIAGRERYRLYGELLTANIYAVKTGMTAAVLTNFYEDGSPELEIPLDPALTPPENAQKYFKRYNKEKRTYTALTEQIKETENELKYLEQLLQTLTSCEDEADLTDIRRELSDEGYIKKRAEKRKNAKKSKPLRFVSSDGFDIYVGKNNAQNEELTLKTAERMDIWLHTKIIPGSHVIIKTNGAPPPERTLDEAAQIACYYSKARGNELVPVDYTQKKNVKKPRGAKTGMVIYDNYKTAYVTADEGLIERLRTP